MGLSASTDGKKIVLEGGGAGGETLHAGTKPKHHTINLLEVKRDVQKRTARRSSFRGRERAIISQNNSWEFQKQSRLGTFLDSLSGAYTDFPQRVDVILN